MQKVCGNIFEDCNVQLYLNVHCRVGGDLVKSSGYMIILILAYTKSFKSIGMLTYRERVFIAVDLKFVQMLL